MTKKTSLIALAVLFVFPTLCLAGELTATVVEIEWAKSGWDKCVYNAVVQVENDTDTAYRLLGQVSFYDQAEHFVFSTYFYGRVKAREKVILTVRDEMPIKKYLEIASYKATIGKKWPITK